MTDHNDLLAGAPAPAEAPKRKPGRPPKQLPASQLPPKAAPKAADVTPPVLASTSAETAALSRDSLVNTVADVEIPVDLVDTVGDGFTGYRPPEDAETPDPNAYELPPVSPEYAAAQARRPIIIGQTTRTYAYQRVLRSGRKL